MSGSLDALRAHYHRIAIPTIHLAFALSLVLHAAALLGWLPNVPMLPFDASRANKLGDPLSVRLVQPVAPSIVQPSFAPAPLPAPLPATSRPRSAPQAPPEPRPLAIERPSRGGAAPPSSPRVIAVEQPSPAATTPPPAETARAPAYTDLASYIEARRRAREPAPQTPQVQPRPPAPAESEQERDNRIAAANLGLDRAPSFGAGLNHGGGIFQVQRMGYDNAEFAFYGWNRHISRNARQTIEVRRGDNPSMEIAVVRRMIALIREHESADFMWDSPRLGRRLSLSARAADNAGLEDFMMREFFPGVRARN